MHVIADGHVHLYPGYDIRAALDNLRRNLAGHAGGAVCMAFLAERSDCHFFRDFASRAPEMLAAQVAVEQHENVLLLHEAGFPDLYIVAGRQVISAERVEILALTTDGAIPDGLPARETVARVHQAGGVPVISWAPGKWFFARRKVVEDLLAHCKPGTLLVGDTSLRPRGWLTPVLMKRALAAGFGLVAGSDPLPFAGEESMLGRYGIRLDCAFDRSDPVRSVRAALTRPGFVPQCIGQRGGLLATVNRLLKNSRVRKEQARTAKP